MELSWIETGGGPLLLAPSDVVGFWEGARKLPRFRSVSATFRWEEGGTATDYDRACDVHDYVGVIDVGPGQAWVLNDEPLPTAEIPGGLYGDPCLVRWVSADSEEDVLAAIRGVERNADWSVGPAIRVDTGEVALFDSAFASDESEPAVISTAVGKIELLTHRLVVGDSLELLLHRLHQQR